MAAVCAHTSIFLQGPASAAEVFTEGLLASFCRWDKLEEYMEMHGVADELKRRQAGTDKVSNGIRDVRDCMKEFLSFTDLGNFPSPVAPEAAVFTSGIVSAVSWCCA
jgi:hypothetical protein